GISSIAVNSIPYATSTNVIGTSTNLTFDGTNFSLGGTGNLSVGGNINCTNDITAYYSSDDRLKIRTDLIDNPIQKINSLTGFKYKFNDLAKSYGLCNDIVQIGLSAQDVQKVVPEAVRIANFDMDFTSNISKSGNNYLAIDYSRLVPLLVEAIKEQNKRIEKLENK
ncbi:MAG: tail fiber domain-containing protein, partial [Bacteroidetes bacterium]|nr:tail fiber domain-containing protein [Bacteroidota bacterium]